MNQTVIFPLLTYGTCKTKNNTVLKNKIFLQTTQILKGKDNQKFPCKKCMNF